MVFILTIKYIFQLGSDHFFGSMLPGTDKRYFLEVYNMMVFNSCTLFAETTSCVESERVKKLLFDRMWFQGKWMIKWIKPNNNFLSLFIEFLPVKSMSEWNYIHSRTPFSGWNDLRHRVEFIYRGNETDEDFYWFYLQPRLLARSPSIPEME